MRRHLNRSMKLRIPSNKASRSGAATQAGAVAGEAAGVVAGEAAGAVVGEAAGVVVGEAAGAVRVAGDGKAPAVRSV